MKDWDLDWDWITTITLIFSLSVNVAYLSVGVEPLNTKNTMYKNKIECIRKEGLDCKEKLIRAYLPNKGIKNGN